MAKRKYRKNSAGNSDHDDGTTHFRKTRPPQDRRWADAPAEIYQKVEKRIRAFVPFDTIKYRRLCELSVDWRQMGLGCLDLSACGLDDPWSKALANDRLLGIKGVKVVNLSDNRIGIPSLMHLLTCFEDLHSLSLSRTFGGWPFNEEQSRGTIGEYAEFIRWIGTHFKRLFFLSISENTLGGGALAFISDFGSLRELISYNNCLSDSAAEAISVGMPQLQKLVAESNRFTERGLRALSSMCSMRELHIGSNFSQATQSSAVDQHDYASIQRQALDARVIIELIEKLLPDGNPGGKLEKIYVFGPLKTSKGSLIEAAGFEKLTDPAELRQYLLDVLEAERTGEAKIVAEARMVFIGVGNAGKTHLAMALAGKQPKGIPVPIDARTKGFDVWVLPPVQTQAFKEKVLVRVFDSGGQPEQYAIHHLFWTAPRNVMVLVIDSTRPWGFEGNRGDYFLRMLEHHFPVKDGDAENRPPVLVVLTKGKAPLNGGERLTPEFVRKEAARHALWVTVVDRVVDALEHDGLDEVRKAIAEVIEMTPGLGAVVLPSFLLARRQIEEIFGSAEKPVNDRRMMTLATYHQVTEEAGVTNAANRENYLEIMNALGDLLHVPKKDAELRDKVINIHWARKALYDLLCGAKANEARGVLMQEDWDRFFPPDAHGDDGSAGLLKSVAKSRGIIHEVTEWPLESPGTKRTQWVVPDLLSYARTKHPWCEREPVCVAVMGDGRYLPEAILLRFIGENWGHISEPGADVFRDRVVMTHKDRTRALVQANYQSEKHSIGFFADPGDRTGKSAAWARELRNKMPIAEEQVETVCAYPHPDMDPIKAMELLCVGVANYRKQQKVQTRYMLAVLVLVLIALVQVLVAPEATAVAQGIVVVGSLIALFEILVLHPILIADSRRRASDCFESLERELLEGKGMSLDPDTRPDAIPGREYLEDKFALDWFRGLQNLRQDVPPELGMVIQETKFRVREHREEFWFAAAAGAGIILIPWLITYLATPTRESHWEVGYLPCLPLSLFVIGIAARHRNAYRAFSAIYEECRGLANRTCDDDIDLTELRLKSRVLLSRLQQLRRSESPVMRKVYERNRDRLNEWAEEFVKRLNGKEKI